ncbi:MAG TPA: hypothetical protein V6C46_06325 [Coleofasciculaceae cyanobacterium]
MSISNFFVTTTAIASRIERAARPAIVAYRFLSSESMRQRYIAAWRLAGFLFCLFVGLAVLTFQAGQKCSLMLDGFVQYHLKEDACDPIKTAAQAISDRTAILGSRIVATGRKSAKRYAYQQVSLYSRWADRQASRISQSVEVLNRANENMVRHGLQRLI